TDATAAWVVTGLGAGGGTTAAVETVPAAVEGVGDGAAVGAVAGAPVAGGVPVVEAGAVAARPPMIPTKPPIDSRVTAVLDWAAGWRRETGSAGRRALAGRNGLVGPLGPES
ncbi:MAG TPA: hypothetical protein VHA57_01270, partial [Actinomycetota bacterium]|nr:hypothetical protein [Actinomycetota bacterium]